MKKQILLLLLALALSAIPGCGKTENANQIENNIKIEEMRNEKNEQNESTQNITKDDSTDELSDEIKKTIAIDSEKQEIKEEVQPANTGDLNIEEIYKELYVTANLNIRSGPSIGYEKIGTFVVNEKVEAFDLGEGWSKVKYNNSYGYVSNKYLSAEKVEIKKEVNKNQQNSQENTQVDGTQSVVSGSLEMDILNVMNDYRTANGVQALKMTNSLNNVASVRAREASQYWSHTRPDGRGPETAFAEQGISGNIAENLAYGYTTGNGFIDGWKASPSHNASMLNGSFTMVGISTYTDSQGRIYAAAEFLQ